MQPTTISKPDGQPSTIYKSAKYNYVWNYVITRLKDLAVALCPFLKEIGCGGGVTEVTYLQLKTMMSGGTLIPGSTYKITGFNKNMPSGGPDNPLGYLPEVLYDDGTNSGITIYMRAISDTEMETSGYGEFYNPIYGDQDTYDNTDGTGLYRIWDGDNPDPGSVPAYAQGSIVFWGGYAWVNRLGFVGFADDILTLNEDDWAKIPYTDTGWYQLVTDEIKVDWSNGILVERYNPENQIRVAFNADQYQYWMGLNDTIQCNPISTMAWGLYSKITPELLDWYYYGITNIEVINSYVETVNFKGEYFFNSTIKDSYFYNNYIGKYSGIENIIFQSYSYFNSNVLAESSYFYLINSNRGFIYSNTLITGDIGEVTINELSNIYGNELTDSHIKYCTLTGISSINTNTLTLSAGLESRIEYNTLNDSQISGNNLIGSTILYNTLNSSIIFLNSCNSSTIDSNSLDQFSKIMSNTLNSSKIDSNKIDALSQIYGNTGTSYYIRYNTLIDGCLITNNGLTSFSIEYNTMNMNSFINSNTCQDSLNVSSYINDNYMHRAYISDNTIDSSAIYNNSMLYSTINSNNITEYSLLQKNIINYSQIQVNTFNTVIMAYNVLESNSSINQNNITTQPAGASGFSNCYFFKSVFTNYNATIQSLFAYNNLRNSTLDFGATPPFTTLEINNVNAFSTNITANLGTATIIKSNAIPYKQIFTRADGTQRLLYYDTSDTPTIVNVNA